MAETWETALTAIEEYLDRLETELERAEHLDSHPEPPLPPLDGESLPPEALSRLTQLQERASTLTHRFARALATARDSANIVTRPAETNAGEYLNERV